MSFRFSKKLFAILLMAVVMAVIGLPPNVKNRLPSNRLTTWLQQQKIHLGLDLQGGTQLDYRIDLTRAQEQNSDEDSSNDVVIRDIVEGVLNTLERRVNNLGVSEPQIYLSNIGDEQHIIVELAGIKDIEEAKRVVGKTIQLEFKEPKEALDSGEKEKIQAKANDLLKKALAKDADFTKVASGAETGDKKIQFRPSVQQFANELPFHYQSVLPSLKSGTVYSKTIEGSDGFTIGANNQIKETKGLYLVQLVSKEIADREVTEPGEDFWTVAQELNSETAAEMTAKRKSDFSSAEAEAIWATELGKATSVLETDDAFVAYQLNQKNTAEKQVRASHILISYQGAERAKPEMTRTREMARKIVSDLQDELSSTPEKFEELAKQQSDDSSGAAGGDLGFFKKGQMTQAFEKAAFSMDKDEISDVVETEFGFHLIKVTDIQEPGEETVNVKKMAVLKTAPDARPSLEKALARTQEKKATKKEDRFTYNELFFDISPDPWKLTGLDGSHFKSASVTYGQLGEPIVAIQFDSEGADLFAELTGRLSGKQMAIFVGGELISAPRVNEKIVGGSAVITGNFTLQSALALAKDLNTGAIQAPILLSGQHTISATLGDEALQLSLMAGLFGFIALAVFMVLYYRFLGLIATLALVIYTIIIVFLLNVTPIVMTLAGIAGIILSIGMAVDANILIFERTREELNSGKNFMAALTAGFERAWSSIRDSNVSSLITCVILWSFGNSIIRGFALMLALGILVSMFTAITVTRTFLHTTVGTWISRSHFLMGTKPLKIMNK